MQENIPSNGTSDSESFSKVAIACICLFVILPLTLVGTVLGRNIYGQPNHPCRVNPVPRPIPDKKWYVHHKETKKIVCLFSSNVTKNHFQYFAVV